MAADAEMSSCAAASTESPEKKPRTELTAFTEEQILSITSSISFDKAIKKQLDAAVKESLQTRLPGMLAAEMPNALASTLAQQRVDVQNMFDSTVQKLQGDFAEARVAGSPAGDAALAAQLQIAVEKYENMEKKLDEKLGEVAAAKPLSPKSNNKYCDDKIAELEDKLAATPRASPAGSLDGASTPGLGPGLCGPAGNARGHSPYPQRLFGPGSYQAFEQHYGSQGRSIEAAHYHCRGFWNHKAKF